MDGTWLGRPEVTLHKGTALDHFFVSRSLAVSSSPLPPQASSPARPCPFPSSGSTAPTTATLRPRPLQGRVPCAKMAPGASALGEVSSRYPGREGGERAGGWVTRRGAVGGAAAAAVAFTFGARERARDPPAPGSPVEVPGPGGLEEVAPRGSPRVGEETALGASFAVPSPGLRAGGRSSVSGAAAGTVERAGRNPPSEDPLEEKREQGGQAVRSEVRPRVAFRGPPSFAQPSWLEPATSPRCFSFSFEYATKPSGRVSFFPPCFCREEDTYLKDLCPRCYPCPLKSFPSVGMLVFLSLDHLMIPTPAAA